MCVFLLAPVETQQEMLACFVKVSCLQALTKRGEQRKRGILSESLHEKAQT